MAKIPTLPKCPEAPYSVYRKLFKASRGAQEQLELAEALLGRGGARHLEQCLEVFAGTADPRSPRQLGNKTRHASTAATFTIVDIIVQHRHHLHQHVISNIIILCILQLCLFMALSPSLVITIVVFASDTTTNNNSPCHKHRFDHHDCRNQCQSAVEAATASAAAATAAAAVVAAAPNQQRQRRQQGPRRKFQPNRFTSQTTEAAKLGDYIMRSDQ